MYSAWIACSNQENTTVCDVVKLAVSYSNTSSNMLHQLAVPWKSAILEIFFIESTSEFKTSVTF